MRWNAVCRDVGRVMLGRNRRPGFDLPLAWREWATIRDDLRRNEVRLCEEDPGRLACAARLAPEAGLEV